jgi:hypothetical protein
MSAALREYLMVVEESAYKTPVVSPTVWTTSTTYGLANAQAYYVRLDGGNAFSMRPRPAGIVTVPYGGGFDVPAYSTSDKQECKGKLSMILSVSQAPFWLSWALQQINTGQTAPWTTTEPAKDLASCSIYHGIFESDYSTTKRRVYLGAKVDAATLTVSEASTICRLTLDISASTPQGNQFDSSTDPTSGTFPVPADNNFPVDPFVFTHAGGSNYITIGGAVRTQFTELTFTCTNKLIRRWYPTAHYIAFLHLTGRHTTTATKLAYVAQGDTDRAHYEGLTAESVSIEVNNGTHGFTLGLNAQNIFNPFEDDLPLDELYMQSSTSVNQWDPTAGSDFTLTIS